MTTGIVKKRIVKRVNRKQNLKKFIDSGYENIDLFLGACKNDEDLLIYTCLEPEELQSYIDKMKTFSTVQEQVQYLIENQPFMNETVRRFDRCVKILASYIKGYICYNGFLMSNGNGDNKDWSSEFWLKYCKICNFYRKRWFFPESLKKKSTVVYNKILFKEFLYITRRSVSGDRKHKAFLATQDVNASVFKISLDNKVDPNSDGEKTLADVIPDEKDENYILSLSNVQSIFKRALELCRQYSDGLEHYEEIRDFYEKQDPSNFKSKVVMLGKIFLYKAGLISPKTVSFIKSLSNTNKVKYNISIAKLNAQAKQYKLQKDTNKDKKQEKQKTYVDYILHKRGCLKDEGEF